MDTTKSLFDINHIKDEAKHTIEKGALTDDYTLDVNEACKILNRALATEVMCVLRYRHHQIIAKSIDKIQVAAEFEEHAKQEEEHMLMLAERINQLGGDPDFNPVSVAKNTITDFGKATTLKEMIEEDLIAERIVIIAYRKMIEWFGLADPTTRRILEHILGEEEDHANDLADLLASR